MSRVLTIVLMTVLLFPGSTAAREFCNRVAAVVNGDCITLFQLNEKMKPILEQIKDKDLNESEKENIRQLKKKLLQNMIDEALIQQEVDKLDLEVSPTEVDTQIREMRNKRGLVDDEDFEKWLKLEELSREQFREQIVNDILKHKLIGFWVKRNVLVTQQEIEAYYEKNKANFSEDRTVELSLIVLPDDVSAEVLRERIQNGEISFAEAARQHSVGPGAEEGGSLGKLEWRHLADNWKQALKKIQVDEISEPFLIQNHKALLLLTDTEAGNVLPLSEVQDDIRDRIYDEKFQENLDEYLQSLRDRSVIDVKL